MTWPADNPTFKLTFSVFRELGSYGGKISFASDVLVQNLTSKAMSRASFSISLLDRNDVRVGTGLLSVEDLGAGQSAKVQFQCFSVGTPAKLNIAAQNSEGVPISTKTVPVTIISVPPGAAIKVDNHPVGVTPLTVRVMAGTHNLELHKDGYADAKTPIDVNPDELPGGSITITLGGLANDTIEMRDGSILMGDVMSMSIETVVVKVNGQDQAFDRNKIKKMFLVERVVTHTVTTTDPPANQPPAPSNLQTPHP